MNSRKGALLALALCLSVGHVTSTQGQTRAVVEPDVRTDLASALRVIRPLVRDDPFRAVRMLEKLKEEYPTHSQVLALLGETYQVIGDIDSARKAYEECLRYHPTDLRSGASLGLLHIQSGERDRGEAVYRDLLQRTAYGVNAYRTIGSTLSRHGYFDLALRFYREGRRRNDDNYILTLDIAYLQKSMGDYRSSLSEYLHLIETTPRQHRLAKNRIMELLRDPGADHDELLGVLKRSVEEKAPHRRVVREILANAYLEYGLLESALEMALLADQNGASDGAVLMSLADRTVDEYKRRPSSERRPYFDLAMRALEAFLEGHPGSPQGARAKLMLVDLLVDVASGRAEAHPRVPLDVAVTHSLEALDWIIASFPGTDYAEQAYLKKGEVIFRIQKQPERALEVYKAGMGRARFYPTVFAERLGRMYLVMGRYDDARAHFSTLVASASEQLREAGVFYSGWLLSFTGEYEAARDTLTGLAEGNPGSRYTNDAIHLAWIIEEGLQGGQEILGGYVAALRMEMAGDTTGVVKTLERIVALPVETPLRARALIKLGETYQAMAQHARAIEAFERFITDYPGDTQLPDAHRRIGEVYEKGYGKMDLALEKYEDILISFPHYIFLDEVREDVTRLREILGGR